MHVIFESSILRLYIEYLANFQDVLILLPWKMMGTKKETHRQLSPVEWKQEENSKYWLFFNFLITIPFSIWFLCLLFFFFNLSTFGLWWTFWSEKKRYTSKFPCSRWKQYRALKLNAYHLLGSLVTFNLKT